MTKDINALCHSVQKVGDSVCPACGIPVASGRSDRLYHTKCYRESYIKGWLSERRKDRVYAELDAKRSRDYRRNNPEKRLLRGAKDRARDFNIPINITLEDIVIPEVCPVLGKKLEVGTWYAPTLDRFDNSKGYIKGNVWVISKRANFMKMDSSEEDLLNFGRWILNAYS